MNSLQDLNTFGQTSLTITDDRFATVIFNRMPPLQPLDQEQTITTTSVAVTPGIEITDIINYSTANVRYQVQIKSKDNLLTSTSLTWPTLPGYMSVSNTGLVYTVTGFRSASDWNTARAFTWTLPSDYYTFSKWWLDVKIIYFDEELGADVEKDWLFYDLKYYEVAALQAQASMSTIITHYKSTEADLQAVFTQESFEGIPKQTRAFLNSDFLLEASAQDASLSAQFALTANVGKIRGFNFAGSAAFTQVTNSAVYKAINLMTNRSYTSNAKNIIFTAFGEQAPYIEEPVGLDATYEVTLTSSQGQWSTTSDNYTAANSITYTGTKTQVNAWFETVTWYPPKDVTSTISASYTQKQNGSVQVTKSFNLEYAAAGTIPTTYYTIDTLGTSSWLPNLVEQKYARYMDYAVVGAGGGGATGAVAGATYRNAGGGGAGQFTTLTNQLISNTSYSVVVGAGGSGGPIGGPYPANGGNGSSSSFNGTTAIGGNGGLARGVGSQTLPNGGNSGNAYTGGAGDYDTTYNAFGGGGAGASANGEDAVYTGPGGDSSGGRGGAGVTSNISGANVTYAVGGPGGTGDTFGGGFITGSYGGGGAGTGAKSSSSSIGDSGNQGVVVIKTHA